tara:strand:+ start:3532 stop:4563 length:1032 start_codon:yes stop_codon:yes gene_type:complete
MNNKTIQYQENLKDLLENLIQTLSKRSADIVRRRFGLSVKTPQTLEHIGNLYNITRERVRQIECDSFSRLRKQNEFKKLDKTLNNIKIIFDDQGGVISESRLLKEFIKEHKNQIIFLLKLTPKFHYYKEQEKVKSIWTTHPKYCDLIQQIINNLIQINEEKKQLFAQNEIFAIIKQHPLLNLKLTNQAILSYLDATKLIEQNNFGEYGPIHWPEVNPRGVKDKAYIVLKRSSQPLHFRQIAHKINTNFGKKTIVDQTVHNELIKDPRFVLVGRGLYALEEHGFEPGTVADIVISKLKKSNKPLSRAKLIKQVQKQRLVHPNTILLSIKTSSKIKRLSNNKYAL